MISASHPGKEADPPNSAGRADGAGGGIGRYFAKDLQCRRCQRFSGGGDDGFGASGAQ